MATIGIINKSISQLLPQEPHNVMFSNTSNAIFCLVSYVAVTISCILFPRLQVGLDLLSVSRVSLE